MFIEDGLLELGWLAPPRWGLIGGGALVVLGAG